MKIKNFFFEDHSMNHMIWIILFMNNKRFSMDFMRIYRNHLLMN